MKHFTSTSLLPFVFQSSQSIFRFVGVAPVPVACAPAVFHHCRRAPAAVFLSSATSNEMAAPLLDAGAPVAVVSTTDVPATAEAVSASAPPPHGPVPTSTSINASADDNAAARPDTSDSLMSPMARKALRWTFMLVNVAVALYTIAIFVAFETEISRETRAENAAGPATPIPAAELVSPNPAEASYAELTWQERYVRLATAVFGAHYNGWIDLYFAVILVGAIVGALGVHLRYAAMAMVATGLYIVQFLLTCSVTANIRQHHADVDHVETKARFRYALAWCGVMLAASLVQMGIGAHLSTKMKDHKADRYRGARAHADAVSSDAPMSPLTPGGPLVRPGKLHRYTTDCSTTPAQKRAARKARDGGWSPPPTPLASGAASVPATLQQSQANFGRS